MKGRYGMKETLRLIKEHDLFNQFSFDDIKKHEHLIYELSGKDKLVTANLEKAIDLLWFSTDAALTANKMRHGGTKYEKPYRQSIWNKFSAYHEHLCDLLEEIITEGYLDLDELKGEING